MGVSVARLSGVICALLWLPVVSAAQSGLAALAVTPFMHTQLVAEQLLPEVDHQVVIGSVRRINNQLRAEREVRLNGELLRLTWQLTDGYAPQAAFSHVLSQLVGQPHTLLYACEGRECGSSSLWANQVLGNAKLYGPDEDQRYLALRLDSQPQRFIALYSITRGNKRSYLHLEQMTPLEPLQQVLYPTPATLLKVLRTENTLTLPPLAASQTQSEAWIALLVRVMRLDSLLRLQLDGVDAPQLAIALKDAGVAAQRLRLGSPEPSDSIVLQRVQ